MLVYTHKSSVGFDVVSATLIAFGSTLIGALYAILSLSWSWAIIKLTLGLIAGLAIEVYIIHHTSLILGAEAEHYRLDDYLPAVISFFTGLVVLLFQILEIVAFVFQSPVVH